MEPPMVVLAAPSSPPYTTASLNTNLALRVMLGILANVACLVPLRVLYRHGELAAVVFILVVETKNALTVAMALVWRNNHTDAWWSGRGLCDVQPLVYNACAGAYVACLLAMMRSLAQHVAILRASPLSGRERRRRNLIQAAIIFPLPLVQLAWTWPLARRRYAVGTLMGCSWLPDSSWPYLLFYVVAEPVFALVAAVYAVITFFRFRQVSQATSCVLTSNRAALLRSQRARRRLYLMVLSILVPFLPITITLCVINVTQMGKLHGFDFGRIHHHNQGSTSSSDMPWNTIVLIPSHKLDFGSLNNGWISILTAIPIFVFFGMTKEALNTYRVALVALGLGRFWPGLLVEYDPDRKALQSGSSWSGSWSGSGGGSRSAGYNDFELVVETGKTKTTWSQAAGHHLDKFQSQAATSMTRGRSSSGDDSTVNGSGSGSSNSIKSLSSLAKKKLQLTPRLASALALGGGDGSQQGQSNNNNNNNNSIAVPSPCVPPPSSFASHLPRNPFLFRTKRAEGMTRELSMPMPMPVSMSVSGPRHSSQTEARSSVFSLLGSKANS